MRQPSRTSGRYWSWRSPRRTAVIRSSGSADGGVSAAGTRCGWSAASSRIRLRPRRRARRRAPPRSFHLRPGLLHPAGHRRLVSLDGTASGNLAGPAMPSEHRGDTLDGVALVEPPDQGHDPRQGPGLVRPAVRDGPLEQFPGKRSAAASIGNSSRTARRSSVSPPPCVYLMHWAYRRDHAPSALPTPPFEGQ